MLLSARRNTLSALVLAFWLAASGCNSQTATPSQPQQQQASTVDQAAVSARLHEIAASGNLSDLHWPNFTDYRLHFQHIYDASNFVPVWLSNGKPTPQALAVIQALQASQQKGLNPDDQLQSLGPHPISAYRLCVISITRAPSIIVHRNFPPCQPIRLPRRCINAGKDLRP